MDNEPSLLSLAQAVGRVEGHTTFLVDEIKKQSLANIALEARVRRLEGYAGKIAVIFTIISFPATYIWKRATRRA